MRNLIAFMVGLLLLAGCARYDYQITQPAELAQRVTDVPARVETSHLTYQMQSSENRLVVQVFNPTEQTIQLIGERSYVIDPRGGSHPLRSQTIGPNSFAKLILPPMRPYLEQRSPRWHFGVGGRWSHYGAYPYHPYGPYHYGGYARPAYYYPYEPMEYQMISYNDPNDSYYWEWRGESAIRLSLYYVRQDNSSFKDDFVIERVKR